MNFIYVNEGNRHRCRWFACNDPFFKDEIIVRVLSDKIVFSKPDISFQGKIHKTTQSDTLYHFTTVCELSKGKYFFDEEESNEDQKVIYFN